MDTRMTIDGREGAFGAYVARPAASPAPAVVVLQEIFGVNADIRAHCDALAAQGFLAVAPDLFWRQAPGVDLDVRAAADGQRALALYLAFDRDAGERDAEDTVAAVAQRPDCTGKVAVLGYCLGGLLSFLTAVRAPVSAAVVYHGGDTEKHLDELDGLTAPMIMHLGEDDEFISRPAQAEIKAALAGWPDVTVYSYPGQRHAFSRRDGEHYDAAAAALADRRTFDFLTRVLS